MIPAAEPWRKNLARTCTNIQSDLEKNATESRFSEKEGKELTFLLANKGDRNNVKFYFPVKIGP